jgi:hypothetical protein
VREYTDALQAVFASSSAGTPSLLLTVEEKKGVLERGIALAIKTFDLDEAVRGPVEDGEGVEEKEGKKGTKK